MIAETYKLHEKCVSVSASVLNYTPRCNRMLVAIIVANIGCSSQASLNFLDNSTALVLQSANTNIVVITMAVTRTDPLSALVNTSKEPIGIIVRYQ